MEMYVLFPGITAIFLLVTSFFVLLAIPKAEPNALKSFGRILAALLWAAAICLIVVALYLNYRGDKGKTLRYKLIPYKMQHRMLKQR